MQRTAHGATWSLVSTKSIHHAICIVAEKKPSKTVHLNTLKAEKFYSRPLTTQIVCVSAVGPKLNY